MTPDLPVPPAQEQRHTTLQDFVFARNEGDLSPEERALWEPERVRLVREGWLLSGAIGFAAAAGQSILTIIRNPALTFGAGSAFRILVWTSCFAAMCAFRLVRPRVRQKQDEFVRSKRLRDLMLGDDDTGHQ